MSRHNSLSIVIGFRDWGLDRLELALRAHRKKSASLPAPVELIVVDFGSADANGVRKVVEGAGAVCVRVEAQKWSRAQALNAGIDRAGSQYVLVTDADIIFGSRVYSRCREILSGDPCAFVLVQCWDLAPEIGRDGSLPLEDDRLALNAHLRPRWGLGGCCAFRKSHWSRIGGLDNRLLVWGGEDTDFTARLRSRGLRPVWLAEPGERIFHIHHEPAKSQDQGFDYVQYNKQIVWTDRSIHRNLPSSRNGAEAAPFYTDAVTVVIATRNRSAYLSACLDSIRGQSLLPRQVIVVDDGSEDDTKEVVRGFSGLDIDYVRINGLGIARARNLGTTLCGTDYVCVMDDDDLMAPDRIRDHLAAMEAGVGFSYGGWIDFNAEEGTVELFPGKGVDPDFLMYGGKTMIHPAVMYETALLREFPYSPSFRAGIDFDVNARMVLAGVTGRHTGTYVLYRRFHGRNITLTSSGHQKSVSRAKVMLYDSRRTRADIDASRRRAAGNRPFLPRPPDAGDFVRLTGFTPGPMVVRVGMSRADRRIPGLVADPRWSDEFTLADASAQPGGALSFVSRSFDGFGAADSEAARLALEAGFSPEFVPAPGELRGPAAGWTLRPGEARLLWRRGGGSLAAVAEAVTGRFGWDLIYAADREGEGDLVLLSESLDVVGARGRLELLKELPVPQPEILRFM